MKEARSQIWVHPRSETRTITHLGPRKSIESVLSCCVSGVGVGEVENERGEGFVLLSDGFKGSRKEARYLSCMDGGGIMSGSRDVVWSGFRADGGGGGWRVNEVSEGSSLMGMKDVEE